MDFFSFTEVNLSEITTFIKKIKNDLHFSSYEANTSFNRNLVFLRFKMGILKTEFTYFPFEPKEDFEKYEGLKIDNIYDIALNKFFTIYQKPRLRDFMDLFMILQKKKKTTFNDLIKDSRIKFDWHIDKIKLGSQLLKVRQLKDHPRLATKFNYSKMYSFYEEKAKDLEDKILKD